MLSTRTGSVGTSATAHGLARYFTDEQTMASYYARGGEVVASPEIAERLGINGQTTLSEEQVANLMRGKRADGHDIVGRTKRVANADGKQKRTGFLDMTWSAGKSVSLAIALTESSTERAALIGAHQRAVAGAMSYAEAQMAVVRRGRGGRLGIEAGEWSYVAFDHFTSRPHEAGATPEPQTHTHALVWNVIVTPDGHVGSMDLSRLKHRTKEFGAVYQALLANELGRLGAAVHRGDNGEAVLTAIPQHIVEAFSSRHRIIEAHAKAKAGTAWETMTEREQIKRRQYATLNTRQAKPEGESAEWEWRDRAEALGYQHRSVLRRQEPQALGLMRHHAAYVEAARLLEQQFEQKSELPPAKIRETIARGLVQTGGMLDPHADIEAVITRLHERGHVDPAMLSTRAGVTRSTPVPRPQSRRINPRLDSRYHKGGGHYDDEDSRGRRM